MPLPIVSSTVAAARAWLRARRPTRESIVIAGALALVFGACYLTAFYVRSELLLQCKQGGRSVGLTQTWMLRLRSTR